MHIHYIFDIFVSKQRTCRLVKACEDELCSWKCTEMEGRRLRFKQTKTHGEYIFSQDFSPQTVKLLVSEHDLELFWSASLNRFSSTYFPKYNNIRIRERSISIAFTQNSILRDGRKEKATRKFVLFAVQCSSDFGSTCSKYWARGLTWHLWSFQGICCDKNVSYLSFSDILKAWKYTLEILFWANLKASMKI